MKKVGVVTLNGYFNYGNRLQNYALQEVLHFLNFKMSTLILINSKKEFESNKIAKLKRTKLIKKPFFLNFSKKLIIKYINNQREKTFKIFSAKNLNELTYDIDDKNELSSILKTHDYFITGSDQVWNPLYPEVTSLYFLTFAPIEKRIAYAPSFGISEIPEEYKKKYKKWLSEIKYISVREESGAKIIKELTRRDTPILVDPTLLITKEKWLTIAKPAKNKPNRKYLVTYFLGGVPKKQKNEINKIAKDNQLKIINLGDIKQKETYITGPSEFLDYINSCEIMFTDSFHGMVFSILFEKPFIVYERIGGKSMYSRVETLLKMFKLEDREYEKNKLNNNLFNINYSHISKILEKERNKSFKFLKEALNIKK